MLKSGPHLKMRAALCLVLSVALSLPSVLLLDTAKDSCFLHFDGRTMICRGMLPNFANESFAQLSKVEQLDVLQCHFRNVPKRAFQGMLGLMTLLINCNNDVEELAFAEDALEDLGSHDRLELLSLNQNNIRQLPENFLCRAPSLQYVFLWRNSLTSVDHLGLYGSCNSSVIDHSCGRAIRTLVLSRNSIEVLPDFMLCTLRSLTRLDVSQNSITRVDPEAFYHLETLLDLDLSENNITLIPDEIGRNLKKLLILNASHNSLLKNVTSTLKQLNRLKILNMTNTGSAMREVLKDESHRFRLSLLVLVMDQNGISDISETLFEPIANWSAKLNMSCKTTSLINNLHVRNDPSISLERLAMFIASEERGSRTGLKYLSLNSNDFDKFPTALKVMPNLQKLSMMRNRIQALYDEDFETMINLHILLLSFNAIQNISGSVFANLRCLLQLHLDHNAIQTINNTAFDNNDGLAELFLQNNQISNVEGLFRYNQELQTLDLSHNSLEVVTIDTFPMSLISLNLSHNRLVIVSPSRFSIPIQLGIKTLDLSHNRLTSVDKGFIPLSVVDLHLNDNRISAVENCTFCAMGRIKELRMNNNLLYTARPEWFYVNRQKFNHQYTSVYLDGNVFICDCNLKTFSNAIPENQLGGSHIEDANALQCQPEFFKGHRTSVSIFSTRSPEDFLCRSNHSSNATLPERCNIFHDLSWDLVIGDCTNAKLTSVPDSLPPNVLHLYFDGNNIRSIKASTFQRMPLIQKLFLNGSRIQKIEERAFQTLTNLRILHLEDNFLHVLAQDTFLGLQQLTELYLSSNLLEQVQEETFEPLASLQLLHINQNQLTTFPVWEFAQLKQLSEIRLSKNPWSCECDYLQRYREWLQKSASRVQDVETLVCNYGDNSSSATPLIAYSNANCYGSLNFLDSKYFPLTTCLSTLALFIFVAGALAFAYREEIRVIVYYRYGLRLFSKGEEDLDGDGNKIFDAFVCYSHEDETFVAEQLMPGLEDIEPPFRLCVHSRDFVIGSFITDNILEAVEKSRRTILILSENFMRSEWCRFEFKTAHLQMFRDPSHRVILIVRGVIPKQLHPEMKVYLKTNTYLMWDDRLFWKRLYYAMPDRTPSRAIADGPST